MSFFQSAEAEKHRQLQLSMAAERAAELGLPPPASGMGDEYLLSAMAQSAIVGGSGGGGGGGGGAGRDMGDGGGDHPPLVFEELAAWARHGKLKQLKEALAPLANKRFDSQLVKVRLRGFMLGLALRQSAQRGAASCARVRTRASAAGLRKGAAP